jgi:hypothetical protein
MNKSLQLNLGFAGALAVVVSCAASSPGTHGAGGAGVNASSTGSAGQGVGGDITVGVGGSGGSNMGCVGGPDVDDDKDGFTETQGDCNDCDPNVNPGAIEVIVLGGVDPVDENCNGAIDDVVPLCDDALALTDADPRNGARAVDLCRFIDAMNPNDRGWGVLDAKYVRANGQSAPQPEQFGIFDGFGPNTHVQMGQRLLALSSGRARRPGDPNACGSNACNIAGGQTTAPTGFPQTAVNCPLDTGINDDVALEVKLRTPTNATGYQFLFDFYSFEFPDFVCTAFNDQFIALVNPPPVGSVNGNISFDSNKNPVSVNLAFFNVCDPASKMYYGFNCVGTCPSPPNPYCPLGVMQLAGTGFDTWANGSGATGWLSSTAPVKGGEEITIRWAIWDTGDSGLDSTVLVDGFSWIANGGTVVVQTEPLPVPK